MIPKIYANQFEMFQVSIVLILAAFLSSVFGSVLPNQEIDDSGDRIVGGTLIPISEARYIASLRYKNSHVCGGTVVSKRHVVTAAHCVFNE